MKREDCPLAVNARCGECVIEKGVEGKDELGLYNGKGMHNC